MDKPAILNALRQAHDSGRPFWGIGVAPESLPPARTAGASWAVVNHTAAFTQDIPSSVIPSSALGLLPYADANGTVLAQGNRIKECLARTDFPVLAAVFASDRFRVPELLLRDVIKAGYGGIENFPSTGLAEGKFKEFLDGSAMGYAAEIDLIRLASAMGLFASAIVFTPEQAGQMAQAGAHMIAFHPGLNADGEHRAWGPAARERFHAVRAAAENASPGILVVRTAHSREEWPPRRTDDGVGVRFDDNFPAGEATNENMIFSGGTGLCAGAGFPSGTGRDACATTEQQAPSQPAVGIHATDGTDFSGRERP